MVTVTRPPGTPYVKGDQLVSTSPFSGGEVGRFQVAGEPGVARALAAARPAGRWWHDLGFHGRRVRIRRFVALLARQAREIADLIHAETGKPAVDALLEIFAAAEHTAAAARNARRVLGPRRVPANPTQPEFAARLEYRPYGVVGVIGPWNYPVFTPLGSIGCALAAGNAVIFKPSEYSPAVGERIGSIFATAVPEAPVLQVIHGDGQTGAALCRSGVDKIAFTGSTATAKAVMAACADTLTPVVLECGGKDAAIVAADADLASAAASCVWGGMSNAGQTCVGIERIYVVDAVATEFVSLLVERARRLTVGPAPDADIGPITMPSQIAVIKRHIEDAIARGARAVIGGAEAVDPPFVRPTILVDVPDDALAMREETFGPTLAVRRTADVAEALRLANAGAYGLGAAVFSRASGAEIAELTRCGMTAVNSALSFTGVPSLPFGGVGASGFGRVHGDDGLREFAWAKSIARRRFRSPLPMLTFDRGPKAAERLERLLLLRYGRSR